MAKTAFEWVRDRKLVSPFQMALVFTGLFLGGLVLLAADTHSSRWGYLALETHFQFTPRPWSIIYWTMAIIPQLAQIGFMYIWLTDIKRYWWALLIVFLFFAVDFVSDVYYLTNSFTLNERAAVSALVTLVFFTIGAEVFVTWGIGMLMLTMPKAILELRGFVGEAVGSTRRDVPSGSPRRERRQRSRSPEPVSEDIAALFRGDN